MKPSQSKPPQTVPAKRNTRKTTTAAKPKKNQVIQISREEVALRAYFIGERRRSFGITGDETSDWVQAEHELKQELKEA